MEREIGRIEPNGADPKQLNAALNNYFNEIVALVILGEDLQGEEDDPFKALPDKREMIKRSSLMEVDLENLLQTARITSYFRDEIIVTFIRSWQMALDPRVPFNPFSEELIERDFFFLDRNSPESGGVFDPNRGRVLETFAIIRAMTDHSFYIDIEERKKSIEEWKSQFRELYSEEV